MRVILVLFLCSFTPLLAQSQQVPQIFAEGIISTGDYETHPAFSPSGDTLYFLKCTADLVICTICISYRTNGHWSAPVTAPFSGKYFDADPFVTKDGNTLYFISNRPLHENDTLHNDWDIWKVDRRGEGWGEPVHLEVPVNSSGGEHYPTLADNGNLYFSSDRPGGKGGSDVYCARLVNGRYAAPENLGSGVNTPDNEYEAFIAPDESYLVYMATIPRGLANADLYSSQRLNGQWSPAKKIPGPVNSAATEWAPKVTRDGKYLFFSSTRNKVTDMLPARETLPVFEKRLNSAGNGLGDIYFIDLSTLEIPR